MSEKWAFPGLSPSVTLEPQAIGAMPGRAILASLAEPVVSAHTGYYP